MFISRPKYKLSQMSAPQWRVAVTRDDEIDAGLRNGLERAGFEVVVCPVMTEGPPPDPQRLESIARSLDRYDWIVCSSVRSVRAISAARGAPWPAGLKAAAVGPVTAGRMRDAGARNPIVGDTFNAAALWQALRFRDEWPDRRVVVTTVAGGRRDVIDGLRAAGAHVDELEAYSMRPIDVEELRQQWQSARPDAVLIGSASQARHLIDAVGTARLQDLHAIVAIGRTTLAAVEQSGLTAHIPDEATFASGIEKLRSMLR